MYTSFLQFPFENTALNRRVCSRAKQGMCIVLCLIVLLGIPYTKAQTKTLINAENIESIAHFRAIQLYLDEGSLTGFVTHTSQDKEGYLWISGSDGLVRYNGYSLTQPYTFEHSTQADMFTSPFPFVDSAGDYWVGFIGLHKFDYKANTFTHIDISGVGYSTVNSVIEDDDGHLWLAGREFGIVKYHKQSNTVKKVYKIASSGQVPITVKSLAYDRAQQKIWAITEQGIFVVDIANDQLTFVQTELDGLYETFNIRDASIDEVRNTLWFGTPKGLMKLNTITSESTLITADGTEGGLPINNVITTFIDSANNLWISLEKEEICVLKNSVQRFMCLKASANGSHKLPVATIEDIYEDETGSLWLAASNFGVVRVSPGLEKFTTLFNQISEGKELYFPNTAEGVVRDNNEIWIATDGAGINIFNYKTGDLSNIRHDPNDENSLSSNSIISMVEDENSDIWASSWGGGIMRINPNTKEVERFMQNPLLALNQSVVGNNVFNLDPDYKGGLWLSVWNHGVQYYDFADKTFSDFSKMSINDTTAVQNQSVLDMQLVGDKLYIVGFLGLEVLDTQTGKAKQLLLSEENVFNYVLVESDHEIWVATENGLIRYSEKAKVSRHYNSQDGQASNNFTYLKKDSQGMLWIASVNGLAMFNPETEEFTRYYERDGLASDVMSLHGEFMNAEGKFYAPSKFGVSIFAPLDMPSKLAAPRSVIYDIIPIETDTANGEDSNTQALAQHEDGILPYSSNSLRFHFTALNFIFPEHNKFRYRLKGWQKEFIEVGANERFASFTNLRAGDYTFELYTANSNGTWDSIGDRYSFTILPPWWATWWAICCFMLLFISIIYISIQWRLAINIKREKDLHKVVKSKTKQLITYAADLEKASTDLSTLNHELETRVKTRTNELQIEVNERKIAESKLIHLAFHDSLTGLPNRQSIVKKIETLIASCLKDDSFHYGVMFLDGDRFKQVNDTHGHIFGDKLLIATKERLLSLLGAEQYAGRLGGDEFTVITEMQNQNTLINLAQTIVDEFQKPFLIENNTVYFNVSIGLVECNRDYQTVLEVLRSADIAMYQAKENGKGTYKLFDERMQRKTLEAVELELGLRQALTKKQFSLVYQPLISLESGEIYGFEALLRWKHPKKGHISPLVFIPVAEETGLIWEIGKWVLKEACRQTKKWHDMGTNIRPSMSVNLSTNQLSNSDFLALIDEIIAESGLDSQFLKLEITESVLIENNHQLSTLYEALRLRKIDLAIDDFGTGYSSLAYLTEIPVQYLKIDRKFVMAIDNDNKINTDALELLRATVSLGKSLRKKITAEGIETKTQLEYLIAFGCDLGQGYLMSKPLNKELATKVLTEPKLIEEGGVNISKTVHTEAYKKRALARASASLTNF